jgi:hypothetical protein
MFRLALVLALVSSARADDRPIHGSAMLGGTLLATGANGDRQRGELEVDVLPYSRYGALLAWRAFDSSHAGLVMAGLVYEAAAARPRLVLDLHADVGADLDQRAPALGGGVHAVITLLGPVGVALDAGGYLVIDGVQNTRFAIAGTAGLGVLW